MTTYYRTPHASRLRVPDFGEGLVAGRPTPTPEQYAAECELAWTYLSKHAPDLIDMILEPISGAS